MNPRFQRKNRSPRPTKPRRVIFVEGETEKQYFNALKQRATKVAITVNFEKNPADMEKEAVKILRGEWDAKRDEIWFLLDYEESNNRQIPQYYQKLTNLIKAKPKVTMKLCLSNVCFEVWLLKHFQETELHGNAKELQNSLTKSIGDKYHKGGKLKVDTFVSKTSQVMASCYNIESPLTKIPTRGQTHIPHLIRALKII